MKYLIPFLFIFYSNNSFAVFANESAAITACESAIVAEYGSLVQSCVVGGPLEVGGNLWVFCRTFSGFDCTPQHNGPWYFLPPVECPESGTEKTKTTCADITPSSNINVRASNPNHIDEDGCIFTQMPNPDDSNISVFSSGTQICITETFLSSGSNSPEPPPTYPLLGQNTTPPLPQVQSPPNYTEESNPPQVTDNLDGSTTTQIIKTYVSKTPTPPIVTQEEPPIVTYTGDVDETLEVIETVTEQPDGSQTKTIQETYTKTVEPVVTVDTLTGAITSGAVTTDTTVNTKDYVIDNTGDVIEYTESGPQAIKAAPPKVEAVCDNPNGCEDFSEITEAVDPNQEVQLKDNLDDKQTELDGVFDEVMDKMLDGSLKTDYGINDTILGDQVTAIIPSGSCADIVMSAHGMFPAWSVTCAQTQIIRDTLAYFLYFFFAMFLFSTFTHSLDGISK